MRWQDASKRRRIRQCCDRFLWSMYLNIWLSVHFICNHPVTRATLQFVHVWFRFVSCFQSGNYKSDILIWFIRHSRTMMSREVTGRTIVTNQLFFIVLSPISWWKILWPFIYCYCNYRRITCLKYLVLAYMLMKSDINPFDSQEVSKEYFLYFKHSRSLF